MPLDVMHHTLLETASRTPRDVRCRSTVHQKSRSNSIAQQQDNAVEQQDQELSSGLDIQVLNNSLNIEESGMYHLINEEYLKIDNSSVDR